MRGWQGHFCCNCNFHLNTLLERSDGFNIIISTVGNYINNSKMTKIGLDRFYETMCFESSYDKYNDADVSKEIIFDSPWCYPTIDDLLPQHGHYNVVKEIKEKMKSYTINKRL